MSIGLTIHPETADNLGAICVMLTFPNVSFILLPNGTTFELKREEKSILFRISNLNTKE